MKTIPALTLAVGILGLFATQAVAGTVHANIIKNDDTETATYIVAADASNLMCSAYKTGQDARPVPRNQIKEIVWREPEDWIKAMELYNQHQYEKAAPALAAVHQNYKAIAAIEDSFGNRAKFYQCNSLRLSGKYTDLMEEYENVRDLKLSKKFKAQVSLFNCWGHMGKQLWPALKLIMRDYEIDVKTIPSYTIPPASPPFKKVSPREIIQIAFLRGIAEHKVMEKKREKLKALIAEDDERNLPEIAQLRAEVHRAVTSALNDYGRVLTVSYGDEKLITKGAMLQFMKLITEEADFEDNYVKQKEAHAVALLYKDLHGGGKVPSEFEPLLKEPVPPDEEGGTQDR